MSAKPARHVAECSPSRPVLSAVAAPTSSTGVIPDLYETPWRAWTRVGWEAAIASNALNHVKPAWLGAYAEVYKAIEDVDGILRRERDTKGAIAPLRLGPLQPGTAAQVMTALTNLGRDRADILVAGADLLAAAAILDIHPQSPAAAIALDKATYGVCK